LAKVIKQRITETLEQNYMPYAMSVIVSRAIPEIDGFKPSHRKLLYTMYKMNLIKGTKTKSANVVGQTMKLNPHGDQAIYATLVRLTRGHDALLHSYIDSKGNFGKTTSRDMKFAASRYTEVKLDNICEEIFHNIDKDAVDFVDNYDGKVKEPILLPTTFPNVLVNSNKGIAVGMASNICSFNLEEICNATIKYIKNNDADVFDIIKGPDFSTAGYLIYNEDEMRKIYETGQGSFKLRAKYEYSKKNNSIEITEIPYTTTVEAIIDKVVDIYKAGKLKEISDVRDETDLKGLRITLDLKRGIDPEKLMTKLFKFTSLEDTFSCNFNLLIDGRPKVLGVKSIIAAWHDFRVKSMKRQLEFDKGALSARLHLLRGLKKIVLDIDKAIKIIRETEEDSLVVPNLMSYFKVDEVQGNYVADIKLRSLNKKFVLNRIAEIKELEETIADIEETIDKPEKLNKLIIVDLKRVIKKYQKPRKTVIVQHAEVKHHHAIAEIDDYKLKIFLTDHNYLKKVSLASLRASANHKLKDDDFISQELEGGNKDELLLFSNKYNLYKIKVHEIIDHKASNLGIFIPNMIELEENEEISFITIASDYSGFMIFVFENGKIAKVPLDSYATKTNRKKLIKAYSDDSKLIRMMYFKEDSDILLSRLFGTEEETLLLLNTSLIPEKATKNTKGVQVVRLKKKSVVAKFIMIDELDLDKKDLEAYREKAIPKSGKIIDLETITIKKLKI